MYLDKVQARLQNCYEFDFYHSENFYIHGANKSTNMEHDMSLTLDKHV